MIISDEKLSAFLDAELPESEMESIRQHISEDETLANRLAELAMVDETIAQHYSTINEQPLSDASARILLSTRAQTSPSNVIAFPWWKKISQFHATAAACLVLVAGYGFIHFIPDNNNSNSDSWSQIAAALDTTASGTEEIIAEGKRVKPRLTFVDQQGHYCRQYVVSDAQNSAEAIACRINDQWESKVSVNIPAAQQQFEYQTATNSASILDQVLDSMIHGEAFDAQTETNIIHQGWKKN